MAEAPTLLRVQWVSGERSFKHTYEVFVNDLQQLERTLEAVPAALQLHYDSEWGALMETMAQLGPKAVEEARALSEALRAVADQQSPNAEVAISDPALDKQIRKALDAFVSRDHGQEFLTEMSLVYLVARMEDLIASQLQLALEKRPEALRSRKQLTYEEILSQDDLSGVRDLMIEREQIALLGQDIEGVARTLADRFGVAVSKDASWKTLVECFYTRNLLSHNGGRINQIFRRKTGYDGPPGRIQVTPELLKEAIVAFKQVGLNLTEEWETKFGGDALETEE